MSRGLYVDTTLHICLHFFFPDLKGMKESHKFGIEGKPRGDNLFIWVSEVALDDKL